ncbi:glutaconate CoA-transferase subunit A [Albimonas donghaensis]|uniref:Glutaconate CoA-transferase subunit A n=1 Tax=Albimonas donghaensis TaxID=356660 RepID=A0A1H3FBS6_9RHOB|nr:glutaconate CoA-transferase subunit A [Albimonas donghaensis]
MTVQHLADAASLAALVPSGARIGVTKGEQTDVPMAMALELVRRGVTDLDLVTIPTCAFPASGMMLDILVGAGCVRSVETSGVSMSELGAAPRFSAAVKAGTLKVVDATCPAVYAALQAGAKGQPFTALRGLIGSDLMAHRDDWAVVANPFEADDPVALLKAINPDVTLFHAPMADRHGNVWIGRNRDLLTLAHASDMTLVTVERIVDGDLMEDETLAPAVIPNFYVTALAEAPGACWPQQADGTTDLDAVRAYMSAARTEEGFRDWLAAHVFARPEAAE